jgi:hypothetical protein
MGQNCKKTANYNATEITSIISESTIKRQPPAARPGGRSGKKSDKADGLTGSKGGFAGDKGK